MAVVMEPDERIKETVNYLEECGMTVERIHSADFGAYAVALLLATSAVQKNSRTFVVYRSWTAESGESVLAPEKFFSRLKDARDFYVNCVKVWKHSQESKDE